MLRCLIVKNGLTLRDRSADGLASTTCRMPLRSVICSMAAKSVNRRLAHYPKKGQP